MIESVVESFYDNLIAEDRYRMILDFRPNYDVTQII